MNKCERAYKMTLNIAYCSFTLYISHCVWVCMQYIYTLIHSAFNVSEKCILCFVVVILLNSLTNCHFVCACAFHYNPKSRKKAKTHWCCFLLFKNICEFININHFCSNVYCIHKLIKMKIGRWFIDTFPTKSFIQIYCVLWVVFLKDITKQE